MTKIAVVTDSIACLPKELVQQYGIEVVPLEIIHDGKVYRDGVDIAPSEFYNLLVQTDKLPTTSAPSPGGYLKVLEKLARKGSDILVITLSTKFSTTIDSARTAADLIREKFRNITTEILDSRTAAGAQGLVVLAAARAAASGENLTRVIEVAKSVMTKVHLVAFLDTLYYLARGGRVPQAAAWANSLLKIKPVFQIIPLSGEASTACLVRTRTKAIDYLIKVARKRVSKSPLHAVVMHSNSLGEAEKLRDHLVSEFNCAEIYVRDFTPVMGVHTGPGLLGIAFYSDG